MNTTSIPPRPLIELPILQVESNKNHLSTSLVETLPWMKVTFVLTKSKLEVVLLLSCLRTPLLLIATRWKSNMLSTMNTTSIPPRLLIELPILLVESNKNHLSTSQVETPPWLIPVKPKTMRWVSKKLLLEERQMVKKLLKRKPMNALRRSSITTSKSMMNTRKKTKKVRLSRKKPSMKTRESLSGSRLLIPSLIWKA
jgi:hypothetical protein